MLARQRRRHGFDWALDRLDRDPPRAHRIGRVGAVSLLEVWAHHEDARLRAVPPRPARSPSLGAVVPILVRYQRRALEQHRVALETAGRTWFEPSAGDRVCVAGADADICGWLAGRAGLESLEVTGSSEARVTIENLRLSI